MNADVDFDLTSTQWETLKALRIPAPDHADVNRFALRELIALELATMSEGRAVITPRGREVMVRGSPRLWDVTA
jgi:hypothetical protein